jgi:NitT/TauT family transport system permease protein
MPGKGNRALRFWQVALFVALLAGWYVLTSPTLLPPFYFDDPNKAAFFFGEPLKVLARIWQWFSSGSIYPHLWVTLLETMLAFVIGTSLGLAMGLWLALSPTASALLDPYLKAFNSLPRLILAPIFAMWFGLDIGSKVALGVTLVFFIVFFNVYQGVKEVSLTVLANARMLGANERQLLRHVYIPSAMSWVFASLHNSVGLAFVGAVVGGRDLRLQCGGRRHPGADCVRAAARLGGDARRAPFAGLAAEKRRNGEAVDGPGRKISARIDRNSVFCSAAR